MKYFIVSLCFQDVAGGMLDLSRSQMEAVTELEQLYDQKEDIEGHLETLKDNLHTVRQTF